VKANRCEFPCSSYDAVESIQQSTRNSRGHPFIVELGFQYNVFSTSFACPSSLSCWLRAEALQRECREHHQERTTVTAVDTGGNPVSVRDQYSYFDAVSIQYEHSILKTLHTLPTASRVSLWVSEGSFWPFRTSQQMFNLSQYVWIQYGTTWYEHSGILFSY
jgi:hypothetical protein